MLWRLAARLEAVPFQNIFAVEFCRQPVAAVPFQIRFSIQLSQCAPHVLTYATV